MKMPHTDNLVSIIIVTFNSKKYILSCIKAIYKSNYLSIEIIAVDNNSSDNTVKIILQSFPEVKIIKSKENLGYAGGNNLGIHKAQGKYIAIVNPDTQVSPNWLGPLITGLAADNVAICQPKIMLLQKKNLINCTGKETHFLGFEWLKDYEKKDYIIQNHLIESLSGSIFLTKKAFFIELGGFDESFFMYYEDGDFSWRTRLMGKQILFVPSSIAYHDYKYTPDENYQKERQKFYLLERNRLIIILKNYSTRTLILILPAFILMELGMNIYFLKRRWWLDKLKGYFWIIKNKKNILEKRSSIQTTRLISDQQLVQNYKSRIDYKELSNPLLNLFVNPFLSTYWTIIKYLI